MLQKILVLNNARNLFCKIVETVKNIILYWKGGIKNYTLFDIRYQILKFIVIFSTKEVRKLLYLNIMR